jgi:hypothetical protein
MRLSLMKGAHVVLSREAYRKFGYLAWFWRDVGDNRSRRKIAGSAREFQDRVPHHASASLPSNSKRTRADKPDWIFTLEESVV